jgi:O-methyltransferase involved in polyketide biosynthesis
VPEDGPEYSPLVARDFSAISASARWLLLAKAHSGLPYAREVAELVFGSQEVAAAVSPTPAAALRRRHFELRARSVDEALELVGTNKIVELASGLSFRGLARAARDDVHYLDTDLPDLVEQKRSILAQLCPPTLAGTYRIEPLDVMDDAAFARALASVPVGPLTIVHEGLLMYLGPDEKLRLAASIREALRSRGGRWITADVYLRRESTIAREAHVEKFLTEHRVEEQKFGDWDEAERFFSEAGFVVERKLVPHNDPALARQTWILAAR